MRDTNRCLLHRNERRLVGHIGANFFLQIFKMFYCKQVESKGLDIR